MCDCGRAWRVGTDTRRTFFVFRKVRRTEHLSRINKIVKDIYISIYKALNHPQNKHVSLAIRSRQHRSNQSTCQPICSPNVLNLLIVFSGILLFLRPKSRKISRRWPLSVSAGWIDAVYSRILFFRTFKKTKPTRKLTALPVL